MEFDIRRIAKLALLRLDDAQAERFAAQMADILEMVGKLPEVGDEAMDLDPAHPMLLREDEIFPSLSREDILRNAPQTEAGCFVVPRVVD